MDNIILDRIYTFVPLGTLSFHFLDHVDTLKLILMKLTNISIILKYHICPEEKVKGH